MKTDFTRLFQDHGIQFWTEGKNVRPGWVHVQCPMCDDHSNHGGFSPNGSYSCWRCSGGYPNAVLARLLNLTIMDIKPLLKEYSGENSDLPGHSEIREVLNRPTRIQIPGEPISRFHRKYIESRGFDPDFIVQKYGVRGTGPGGSWEGVDFKLRLIIPIYDALGTLVNFQGRDITGKQELRYKGPPVSMVPVHHKELLYGAHRASHLSTIGVVEGVMDQWRMGDGFVCTFGTSLTTKQIYLLSKWDKIIFLFDPEEEAQSRAEGVARTLASLGKHVELVVQEGHDGRDPAEWTDQEALEVRRFCGFS